MSVKESQTRWKVVPLSSGQLLDVRPEDILEDGHFRKCSAYRGGGGYDQFPYICEKRLGERLSEQFIVQLFGCNLDCPYCYVTRAGVWGQSVSKTTKELVDAFVRSDQEIFHLMGGAPALYIQHWPKLIAQLLERCPEAVFHSDLMLTEKTYPRETLQQISPLNTLFAVDIKGLDQEEHMRNTRKPFLEDRFWENLVRIEEAELNYYFTFTNISEDNQSKFWTDCSKIFGSGFVLKYIGDCFSIDLIEYEALPHVDEVPWGYSKDKEPGIHGT